jgi:DNA-binding transcriptional ArsR family regulator
MATRGTQRRWATTQDLAKALSHELRAEVLTILTERVASAVEIGRQLDREHDNISYHIKVLVDLGYVELVREKQVEGAGAIEKFYRAVVRPRVDADQWETMHPIASEHFAWQSIRKGLEDFNLAAEADCIRSDKEIHLSRTPGLLDKEGAAEAFKLCDRTYDEFLEIQARSDERRQKSGETGIHFSYSQLCFEMPEPPAK